jgi:F-type H+-transporting ATPase subunit gamma
MEDDVTKDLAEFSLANAIYAALIEGHACEISARCATKMISLSYANLFALSRNAMDNAQKNASDMISSLQMKYNRGRQAAITNELVDIITGGFHVISHPFLFV